MKKVLLVFLGFSSLGSAQITLNSSHFPATGDSLRISTAVLDNTLDFQTTGPNSTWDFSSLQNSSQVLNEYKPVSSAGLYIQLVFGSFAPSNYKASYYLPSANSPLNNLPAQLPITISDISQFYKITADSMTMVGIKMSVNGQEIPAKSDTIETKYDFPLNYGDTHFSRGYTTLDLNPIYDGIWKQHRTRSTEVDGWGQITTPLGSFNALRIHHQVTEIDSFYVSISGFAFWLPIPSPLSHEYEWRAVEEKEPILLIRTSDVLGTETINSIEYKNNFLAGISEATNVQVTVFPNPVQDVLGIEGAIALTGYAIYGMDGKLITQEAIPGLGQKIIDVTNLQHGMYSIQIQTANGICTKTFVK